jgi:amidase
MEVTGMATSEPTAKAPELCTLGALELARRIRDGEVSSRQVVEAHLARIEELNGRVRALRLVLADSALQAADEVDARRTAGEEIGPLGGVPVTVKENVDPAGTPTTAGTLPLAEAVPPRDAPSVAGLRAAGAIPIGRSNMPDLGLRWHTDSAIHGPTDNPWAPGLTAGGSSGGEAAALATGMSPLGVGNDLGGSLRWPAQCCGIASLKPSFGRVALASSLEFPEPPLSFQLMAVNGPMARRVADLRTGVEAISVPSPRDPWQTASAPSGPPLPRAVTLVTDPMGQGVDPDIAAGVAAAAEALADAGYSVQEGEPPELEELNALFRTLVLGDVERTLDEIAGVASEEALSFLRKSLAGHPPPDAAGWAEAWRDRLRIARAWSEFQGDRPLILGPVAAEPPFPAGADLTDQYPSERNFRMMRLVVPVNVLGLPAAVVPVGVASGLPQVVQLIGPRFREDLCLDAAEAIEDRRGTITPIDPVDAG